MDSGKLYILQYRPGGEIIEMDPDGGNRRTLLGNLLDNLDGIVIDKRSKTLYWTNMGPAIGPHEGEFFQADGSIECIGLNGANRHMLVGHGLTVTPKQVTADFSAGFLYWCDREGMRVMRSNLDGSNVTVLVRNGVFPADSHDVMRHCVGIAVDPVNRYIYWTQKGPPDGGKGRIFRSGLEIPAGQQPENRTDIELLIDHLPEPIDLSFDTLLDQVRVPAEQHGCDDSDLSHDVRRQHSCDGLGRFDLGWIGNQNLELLAGRCIIRLQQAQELRFVGRRRE